MKATLAPFLGRTTPRAGGLGRYASSATIDDGRSFIAWDGQGTNAGTIYVDIVQSSFDTLGLDRGLELVAAMVAIGFRASRFDLWLDDYAKCADPQDVLDALDAGDAVTHARGHSWHGNSEGGLTANVGSRTSERMLRVYRTQIKHGYDATRWEIEMKDDAARASIAMMLADRSAATVGGLIVAFVDFRGRAGFGIHGARAPRLAWWLALVGTLEGLRSAPAHACDSLARRATWIIRQVAPTLAALWAHPDYGDRFVNDALSHGLDRLGGIPEWATGT